MANVLNTAFYLPHQLSWLQLRQYPKKKMFTSLYFGLHLQCIWVANHALLQYKIMCIIQSHNDRYQVYLNRTSPFSYTSMHSYVDLYICFSDLFQIFSVPYKKVNNTSKENCNSLVSTKFSFSSLYLCSNLMISVFALTSSMKC